MHYFLFDILSIRGVRAKHEVHEHVVVVTMGDT
jgi:hypothetical protein